MSVKILYNNFPLTDKASATFAATDKHALAKLSNLNTDITPLKFASFEYNYMSVDGDYFFYTANQDIGYISNSQSEPTGYFSPYPQLTITLPSPISTDGLTLYFSTFKDEYCKKVTLTYKNGNTVIKTVSISPDSNVYTARHTVDNYNTVIITFVQTSKPFHWARLYRVDLGEQITYEGDDVYGATLTESADVTACQIEANTSVISVRANQSFQKGQSFEIWFNNKLYAKHFLKSVTAQKDRYTLNGVDYLDKLGEVDIPAEYVNKQYYTNTSFESLLSMYVRGAFPENSVKPPIYVDENVNGRELSGKIESQVTARTALLYLCFAAGAYVDTTRADGIYIKDAEAALARRTIDNYVYEEHIFEGDKTEIKTPYKYVRIKYKDSTGAEQSSSKTNTASVDTATAKEFDTPFVRASNPVDTLNVAALYYFNNVFYTAKSILTNEKIMSLNGMIPTDIDHTVKGFAERLVLNLDGSKLIGDVRYKVV